MIVRSLTACLTLFFFLAFCQAARAQDVAREKANSAELTKVQKRLVDLEDLLQVLMREIEVLRKEAKPASGPTAKGEVKIFVVRNANAPELARVLRELFPNDDRNRIAVHKSTNAILVRAPANELEVIQAIITRLDSIAADANKDQ